MLTQTWLGRAIRAAAVNPSSAELVGIKVTAVAALVFGLGIAAAGAGGAITGVLYPFVPGSHYQWIARLLAIVVLGGLGSLNGAMLGALIFGIAETLTAAYVSPSWATAVPYAIVFAVLLIRPQGLLGVRLREDAVARHDDDRQPRRDGVGSAARTPLQPDLDRPHAGARGRPAARLYPC